MQNLPGCFQGIRVGFALSGNIESSSVSWSRNRNRKPSKHGHAMIEPHQFHRDLSLVMIHSHHRIKLTPLSPDENRIGRMRSIRLDPKLLNFFYSRFDDVAFLGAEIPTVTGMGIKGRHTNPGHNNTGIQKGLMCHLARIEDTLLCNQRSHVLQRDMRCNP